MKLKIECKCGGKFEIEYWFFDPTYRALNAISDFQIYHKECEKKNDV